MTDKLNVERLRALDEAATAGKLEWDAGIIPPDGPGNYADLYVTDVDMEPIILAEFNDNIPGGRGNAELWCYLRNAVPAILAMAEDNARMREALERAGLRFDIVAPLIVENQSAFAVTKWANEARAAALGKDQA